MNTKKLSIALSFLVMVNLAHAMEKSTSAPKKQKYITLMYYDKTHKNNEQYVVFFNDGSVVVAKQVNGIKKCSEAPLFCAPYIEVKNDSAGMFDYIADEYRNMQENNKSKAIAENDATAP